MKYILLTTGGFRNWAGLLAEEVFEYLLGCVEVTPFIGQRLRLSEG
ncbi:hypothetical protein AB7645_41185 [Bradyrhizobium sp. 956_D2_N1_5]